MTRIAERNYAGQYYVSTRIGVAKTKRADDFPEFGPNSNEHKLLTELIEVHAKGFRGIVVTALTGIHLDKDYDPLNNFYGCNPRSIFEGGIWYALTDNGIPCGKSDPLNVAKNINQLNEHWAQGKRPQTSAMAAVEFLRLVTTATTTRKVRLIDYFFYRLWAYAQSVENYRIAGIDIPDKSTQATGSRLVEFTLEYPEAGYLPQHLVGQLLAALFRSSEVEVVGGNESVFGTNTTSGKPADIWLEIDGFQTNLYEVTVKPISRKRLDDCLDALRTTGHINHRVTFICRIEADTKELDVIDGSFEYKGKIFDFIDYRYFSLSICALLNDKEFSAVANNIASLVQGGNISMKTKSGWNKFFGSEI